MIVLWSILFKEFVVWNVIVSFIGVKGNKQKSKFAVSSWRLRRRRSVRTVYKNTRNMREGFSKIRLKVRISYFSNRSVVSIDRRERQRCFFLLLTRRVPRKQKGSNLQKEGDKRMSLLRRRNKYLIVRCLCFSLLFVRERCVRARASCSAQCRTVQFR